MSVKVSQTRNIQYLLNKYQTKQPGEILISEKLSNEYGMKNWRTRQKMMQIDLIAQELNMNKFQKERAKNIISRIANLKNLCGNCSQDTILTGVCFYIIKEDNCSIKLKDYNICSRNNLSLSTYSTIVTKIAKYYRQHLPHNY